VNVPQQRNQNYRPNSHPAPLLNPPINLLTPQPQRPIPALIIQPLINPVLQFSNRHKVPALALAHDLRTRRAEQRVQRAVVRRRRRRHVDHQALEAAEQRRVFALQVRFDYARVQRVGC
jgi:hypothetical protein